MIQRRDVFLHGLDGLLLDIAVIGYFIDAAVELSVLVDVLKHFRAQGIQLAGSGSHLRVERTNGVGKECDVGAALFCRIIGATGFEPATCRPGRPL